jgi:NAD(P)-dependent dehydrogenase (short-subunit alcohol dehydrogenase family)
VSRTVVVTGAASGNGRAITTLFLQRGDKVAAVDVSGGALHGLRDDDWMSYRDRLLCLTADVSREADIDAMFSQTTEHFGRIEVLINNAGTTGGAQATLLHETSIEAFDAVFAVNVRAVFLGCRAVIPTMLAHGGGVIVNIASVAALAAFPGLAAYTASKGAVLQLTRSVAVDYARLGIRSGCAPASSKRR